MHIPTVKSKHSTLITVGQISGVFGIKGWLKVKSFTEPEKNLVMYSPLWLKTRHGVKQAEMDAYQFKPNGLIVHLVGVDDRAAAEGYAKVEIAIEQQQLAELDEGEFYWHQLQGLKVVSCFESGQVELGIVDALMETGANDVLVVKPSDSSADERERLVPFVWDRYIKNVDLVARVIIVDWDPSF